MTQSTSATTEDQPLAHRIAAMMRIGTAVSSVLLSIGPVLAYLQAELAAAILLAGGCGLLALLPVIRLAMMAGHFARLTQLRFVLTTLAVFALVLAGGVIGIIQ